jgi:hypothetical protein
MALGAFAHPEHETILREEYRKDFFADLLASHSQGWLHKVVLGTAMLPFSCVDCFLLDDCIAIDDVAELGRENLQARELSLLCCHAGGTATQCDYCLAVHESQQMSSKEDLGVVGIS